MRIKLYTNSEYKKARRQVWKHILKHWIRFDFKHSFESWFGLDSPFTGKMSGCGCSCNKIEHNI